MPLLQKVKLVSDACVRPPKCLSGWGHATCGILILDPNDDSLLAEKAFYLGEMTVPQAEYRGLIMALNEASQYSRRNVEAWLDSQLVVRQLTGFYRITKDSMKELYDEVKRIEPRFLGIVTYYHHPRTAPMAKMADALAAAEMKRRFGQ